MDFRAKLTFYGLLLGFPGVLIGNIYGWGWSILPWALLIATCLAAIWIEDSTRRPSLITHLTAPTYTTLNTRLTARPASWPRDWRLYDWSLRLAVVYPAFLMFACWLITGQKLTLGAQVSDVEPLQIFASDPPLTQRLALGLWLIIACAAPIVRHSKAAKTKGWIATNSRLLAAISNTGILFIAVVYTGSIAGAVALIIAYASLTASKAQVFGMAAVSFAFLASIYSSYELALAVGCLIVMILVSGPTNQTVAAFTLMLIGAASYFLTLGKLETAPTNAIPMFFMAVLLPLLNAVFDYISYLITLSLLRWGRRSPDFALWAGVIDLAAALILFTLSGTAMIAAIAAAHALSGTQLFPLEPLFQGIHDTPGQYWWLYAMLFSTILPTALHGIIALAAVPAATPLPWRQRFADWAGQVGAVPAIAAPLAIGAVWTVCIAIALAIPTLLVITAINLWPHLGAGYLGWFEWAARSLGQLPPL